MRRGAHRHHATPPFLSALFVSRTSAHRSICTARLAGVRLAPCVLLATAFAFGSRSTTFASAIGALQILFAVHACCRHLESFSRENAMRAMPWHYGVKTMLPRRSWRAVSAAHILARMCPASIARSRPRRPLVLSRRVLMQTVLHSSLSASFASRTSAEKRSCSARNVGILLGIFVSLAKCIVADIIFISFARAKIALQTDSAGIVRCLHHQIFRHLHVMRATASLFGAQNTLPRQKCKAAYAQSTLRNSSQHASTALSP